MDRNTYLDSLTEQMRSKRAAAAVREEVEEHIEEQKQAFLAEGMTGDEAENAAVAEMGDPVEAGVALDLVHRPRMPWGSMAVILVLGVVGMLIRVMLTKNLPVVVFMTGDVLRQIIYLALGFVVMTGVCFADYSRIGCRARIATLILAGFLLAEMYFGSVMVNGMPTYVFIPGLGQAVSIRPFLMLFAPLYGGILYRYKNGGYGAFGKACLFMLPGLLCAWIGSGMVDLFLMLVLFAVLLSVALWLKWFAVDRKKVLLAVWSVAILLPVGTAALIWRFGNAYQKIRLALFLHPADQGDYSWQTQTIREVLAKSKLVGTVGFQTDGRTIDFPGVDYVLTYVAWCYGILAAVLLIGMIVCLILRLLRISIAQGNQLGRMMGAGCAVAMALQIVPYVLANLGVILPGQIYCPFITHGGTGMLITYVLFGILLSVYRYQDIPFGDAVKVKEKRRLIP